MSVVLRIALCQVNLPVGDIDGNVDRVRERVSAAQAAGADLVVFPELALTGYPPEDLLLKPEFSERARGALGRLATELDDVVVLVGFPQRAGDLYNAAGVVANGRVHAVYQKAFLPNYGVFDEQRYFANGHRAVVLDLDGARVGVTICEDLWYPGGPAQWAAIDGGAEVILNLSASPYHRGKGRQRERMFETRCVDYNCFLGFCNAVGGQDELVFDGHSLVIDPSGAVVARGCQFDEDLVVADLDLTVAARRRLHDPRWRQRLQTPTDRVELVRVPRPRSPKPTRSGQPIAPLMEAEAEVYRALVVGTADYFRKNGFSRAVLGLSGGIDSALALVVAAEALGPDAVTAVSMPSRYTASLNREDAGILAARLGVSLIELPIHDLVNAYGTTLAAVFRGTEPNVAEENLQARIRGNLLMALSNKFGWLVLTTGNKSEMSVGYATLYGDMAGGFSILKDVLKTWVYRICRWCNRTEELIPGRILDKAPTAELRPDQVDTDSLPPYEVLDVILEGYVEHDRTPCELEALGLDRELVERVVHLVDRAEYKRRQAPPGVRVTTRAFGKDRRLPITNRYRTE